MQPFEYRCCAKFGTPHNLTHLEIIAKTVEQINYLRMRMVERPLSKPKWLVNKHNCLTKHSHWHNFVHGSCNNTEYSYNARTHVYTACKCADFVLHTCLTSSLSWLFCRVRVVARETRRTGRCYLTAKWSITSTSSCELPSSRLARPKRFPLIWTQCVIRCCPTVLQIVFC